MNQISNLHIRSIWTDFFFISSDDDSPWNIDLIVRFFLNHGILALLVVDRISCCSSPQPTGLCFYVHVFFVTLSCPHLLLFWLLLLFFTVSTVI
ncbi:hypothetical protein WN944_026456 [Citrus x changshan-huyou]|uniref:Uncharacterized protein n=1 Tax=Citrus x changshan-huyou TaxID=2935761 RepID=A0AAP0QEK4_9ROSI